MMTALDLNPCYQELGFSEPPFRITPDTDFFFPGPRHLEALQHLRFGIASGGLTMLTGEVGLGKTLLCRYLLRQAPPGVRFAYLINPDQSYADLLTSIYEDLTGIVPTDCSLGALQRELPKLLLRLAEEGEQVVVLVDEAHRLSGKVLEGLRLLSNLDTEKNKLMCLLLVGQPELEQKLKARAFRPLRQRISVRYRLQPFGYRETRDYLLHRLAKASQGKPCGLQYGVPWFIYVLSQGVPRRINQLCDRALLGAFAQKQSVVSHLMVWKASQEFLK
ncbi:MAG: AAA family ATPase [Nitrospira sp.]|nr:AAA family ATPase [Nitrospira sp.]